MQKQFKYIYNNEEVSREDFEKLAGDSFKWFDGGGIVSAPFSSFDSFFTGNFKSNRQINDHVKSILEIKEHPIIKDVSKASVLDLGLKISADNVFNNPVKNTQTNSKCSPQCYCDGSCKKDLNITLEKPTIDCRFTMCGQKDCTCCYPQEKNINSTRHKSQAGETYKEVVGNLEDDINNRLKLSKKINKESIEKYKSLFTKEDKKLIKEIGVKYNQLKPRLDVVINTQFPKALQLIALATEYGNSKYKETDLDMLNFKRVVGGSQTYFDSCARHSTDRNGLDESGLPHIIHAVWSSLAGLELWAEENRINIKEFTENYMKNLQD